MDKNFGLRRNDLFIDLPIITFKGQKYFVSQVPFINVASQGKTREESVKNLIDAVKLYFKDEDVEKIIKEKIPIPFPPVSLELLRFNVTDKKVVPVTRLTS